MGFEIGLLEDRIQADFTVYSSLQKDQILSVPTPSSTGYSFRYINAGEVKILVLKQVYKFTY
ncbi:MAG: hypothetical protein IPO02_01420 [Bacteroidetes bacterium]|nr:hypothetical protein [Bacteroidota bacterium]